MSVFRSLALTTSYTINRNNILDVKCAAESASYSHRMPDGSEITSIITFSLSSRGGEGEGGASRTARLASPQTHTHKKIKKINTSHTQSDKIPVFLKIYKPNNTMDSCKTLHYYLCSSRSCKSLTCGKSSSNNYLKICSL